MILGADGGKAHPLVEVERAGMVQRAGIDGHAHDTGARPAGRDGGAQHGAADTTADGLGHKPEIGEVAHTFFAPVELEEPVGPAMAVGDVERHIGVLDESLHGLGALVELIDPLIHPPDGVIERQEEPDRGLFAALQPDVIRQRRGRGRGLGHLQIGDRVGDFGACGGDGHPTSTLS